VIRERPRIRITNSGDVGHTARIVVDDGSDDGLDISHVVTKVEYVAEADGLVSARLHVLFLNGEFDAPLGEVVASEYLRPPRWRRWIGRQLGRSWATKTTAFGEKWQSRVQ
jgi:hypothetical protein